MKRMLRSLLTLALLFTSFGLRSPAPVAAAAGFSDSLAPGRGASVQTQNGSVLHSPTIYAIYWKQVDKSLLGQTFYYEAPRCYGPGCLSSYGTDTNYENRTGTFLQDVGGSAWFGVLNQYWDADANGQQTARVRRGRARRHVGRQQQLPEPWSRCASDAPPTGGPPGGDRQGGAAEWLVGDP